MTAKELIEAVAKATGYTRVQVKAVLQAEAAAVAEATGKGDECMTMMGKFAMVDSPARSGRNPRTGEPMDIPARRTLKFRAKKPAASDAEAAD